MRRLCLFAALLLPLSGSAQLTGTFTLDKTTFAPGEPVFLHFTLTNQGTQPVELTEGDPYSAVSGYTIHISRAGQPFTPCNRGFNGSGLSGFRQLAPHASWSESLLLNYPLHTQGDLNPPVRLSGDYLVDAVKQLDYGPPGWASHAFPGPGQSTVHQVLTLSVDPTLQPDPAIYAPYFQQLTARDEPTRREAARTLATLAPPALEPLLLTFATSKDRTLRQFAPLALANLGTHASLNALAAMLAAAEPGTYEADTAAQYLGRTHDPQWLPLLLAIADHDRAYYLSYAADSGGAAAIPALLERMRSTQPYARDAAIQALGSTGSPQAIPLLIGLLHATPGADPNSEAFSANASLSELTHHSFNAIYSDQWIADAHQHWQHWWLTSGQQAPAYRSEDCTPNKPLP